MDSSTYHERLVDRVHLLQEAEGDVKKQQIHLELCRRDPVYWFNNFAWTFNPKTEEKDFPFILYPFQEWVIQEWADCIERQEDICIEKSREMGASWLIVLLFQWGWLFRDGWHFHCGSRKEDFVDDNTENPSTLFGKIRYNNRKLPLWMKPKITDKKLMFYNHDNGNVITGESSNVSFGRGARYRAILFDELAFWEVAEPAWEGCADTTSCRIALSTPNGESNLYYKIMHNANNEYRPYPNERELMVQKGIIAA